MAHVYQQGQVWYARVNLHDGGRRAFRLPAKTQAEAKRQASLLDAQQYEIRLGLRAAPTPADENADRPLAEVIEEYLAWGRACGGRNGHPWSPTHSRDKERLLAYWTKAMNLQRLADAANCLPAFEKALRHYAKAGRPNPKKPRHGKPLTGKTLRNAAEALTSFFAYCAHPSRRYLERNPLDGLGKYDATPKTIRRALTAEETRALLDAAPDYFRMTLTVALATGFRRGELAALTPDHLDREACTLRVDASRDKARKERRQPIPRWLAEELHAYGKAQQASDLYRRFYRRRDAKKNRGRIPEKPLLFVPLHSARTLAEIADRAGVAKVNDFGTLDFHGTRVAYINNLLDSGADVKTVQTLARHASPELTMNTYGRAKPARLAAAAEVIGEGLLAAAANSEPDDYATMPKVREPSTSPLAPKTGKSHNGAISAGTEYASR